MLIKTRIMWKSDGQETEGTYWGLHDNRKILTPILLQ